MAITTSQYIINAGWARTDVIDQVEKAWNALSWNGAANSGIVTYISGSNVGGGGTVGSGTTIHWDVRANITSGVGTGASFDFHRSSGVIYLRQVNRLGTGYTTGEQVTIKADQIGGASNGATDIILTLKTDTGIGTYGGTNKFLLKDNPVGATKPFGVAKHVIDEAKEYGVTYRSFQMYDNTTMTLGTGSAYNPYQPGGSGTQMNSNRNNETTASPTFKGNYLMDLPFQPNNNSVWMSTTYDGLASSRYGTWGEEGYGRETIASSQSYQLDLNVFRSGLDQKFAVFSYRQPTLSSTKLRDNTFLTYIIHNYTGDLWDLDDQFLGGVTTILPSGNDLDARITFNTYPLGMTYKFNSTYQSRRSAEAGYMSWTTSTSPGHASWGRSYASYKSTNNPYQYTGYERGLYVRNNAANNLNVARSEGGYDNGYRMPDSTNYNAVVKGIPLGANFIPVPYYIPDDFVLIDFHHDAPAANIQQYDTVTISGSEVYTVIQGSYDQTSSTDGILFCARTT